MTLYVDQKQVAETSLDGFMAAAKHGYNLLCMPILKGIDGLAEDEQQAACGMISLKHEIITNGVPPWSALEPAIDAALSGRDTTT